MTEEPEKIIARRAGRAVFYPTLRFLFDWLLILNSFLFALMASRFFHEDLLISIGVAMDIFFLLSWFFFLRPLLKIVIENNAVTGPFKLFTQKSILLRKVDLRRSLEHHRRAEFLGYRDLWSVDGERIRLYRRFLGKTQQYQIIKLIKEHPFHETAPPRPSSKSN